MNETCPCGSGNNYEDCCGRFHRGAQSPVTAEALMRSRYSAFAKQQVEYLLATWHVSTRPAELNLDAAPAWTGLEIVAIKYGEQGDHEGWVEFIASCMVNGKSERLHENSRFVKEEGRWFYVDGELKAEKEVKFSRNAPCPCGSGKKYKRCCGQS